MELKDKKILILGLGREGKSSFQFLRKRFPKKTIGLADENRKRIIFRNVKTYFGKNYLKAIENYEIIIKSPGIKKDILTPYLTNQVITSQTEIFLEKNRDKTICITGSKGKGITSDLIYKSFKNAGKKAYLIGNIGKPALDFYNKDGIFIFEISSHQLQDLKIGPHIAVFLNIYPDHLDFFKTFDSYFGAKSNITLSQNKNDYFIFNGQYPKLLNLAQKTKAQKIDYSKKELESLDNPFLKGKIFLEDVRAAICVLKLFNLPIKKDYKPFENRLEIVGEFKGIKFINDSASTLPQSTIAALETIDNVDTLILGGSTKGSNFKELAEIIEKKEIKNLILFPPEGKRILKRIKKKPSYFFANNMKQAVKLCYQEAEKICLLSPACASFSCFKDYQDRGEQFKKYAKELNEK
jgi:UDP-N-acetylmuramoyl-L-alanine---L-glutamate ligase